MAQNPAAIGAIRSAAARYGLDWRAMAAVANAESGLNPGNIGDNGTSYGLFQLHTGGALGNTSGAAARRYLDPNLNAQTAARMMAPYARGLRGTAAIDAIVRRFERPADPSSEVARASSYYGSFGSGPGPGAAPPTSAPSVSVAAPAAGPNLSVLQSLLDANSRLAKIPAVRLPHVSVPAVVQGTSQVDAHTVAQNLPSGSSIGNAIVRAARQFLGVPYVWGGTSPKGFDCSGLTQYVFKKFGINIPRVSEDQVKAGRAVPVGQQQPGDLLFFRHANGDVGHVGIAIGHGMMLEAPHTGDVVKIIPLAGYTPVYAVRRFAG